MARSLVGVFPATELHARTRLFAALSKVLDADFVDTSDGDTGTVDAAIAFRSGAGEADGHVADVLSGIPTLFLHVASREGRNAPVPIRVGRHPHLDPLLRDRTLGELGADGLRPLAAARAESVLAEGPEGPLWCDRSTDGVLIFEAGSAPAELGHGERLKARLTAGRSFALLPIVHFLRSINGPAWQRPAPRASFIFDDGNLHWRSYGYLSYPEVAADAARRGYAAAIAIVPLDTWFARRDAIACFRAGSPLSLIAHGYNHTKRELSRPLTPEAASNLSRGVVRRIGAFERRTGLRVGRLMAPPHGRITETIMAALRRAGFEGVCYWGPSDAVDPATIGWHPADIDRGDGLPGLHRLPLDAPIEELILRTLLGQPLLLSGHHTDLAGGLDVLSAAVDSVEQIGAAVEWGPIDRLLRSNVVLQREGGHVRARMFARRVRLDPFPDDCRLVVEWPGTGASDVVEVTAGEPHRRLVAAGMLGAEIDVPGGMPLEATLCSEEESDPVAGGTGEWLWPLVRRSLTEARDRALPLLRRGEGRASARSTE